MAVRLVAGPHHVVPPAVFLSDFLSRPGPRKACRCRRAASGDERPEPSITNVLLKPLFSFAGKGIEFEPTQAQLEADP